MQVDVHGWYTNIRLTTEKKPLYEIFTKHCIKDY